MPKRPASKLFVHGLFIALFTSGILSSSPLHAESGRPKSPDVEAIAPAKPGATIPATVQWQRRVELSTPLTATVTDVLVEPGDTIEPGEALLRLDPRALQARARKAQAELTRLKTTRDEADVQLHRARALHRRQLVSDHELQMMRIEAADADAEFSGALATNAQAQLDLEHAVLRAPFHGVVVQRLAEPGQTVMPTVKPVPLLVVAETGRMHARAEVQRDALAKIQRGQAIKVIVAGQTYPGTVKYVGLEPLDGLGGQFAQYELVVEFNPPANAGLYAGQPAQLSVK